ncbi:MAG: hypothetical protein ACRD4P_10710, partial [Bryobacteraceae bacterium]
MGGQRVKGCVKSGKVRIPEPHQNTEDGLKLPIGQLTLDLTGGRLFAPLALNPTLVIALVVPVLNPRAASPTPAPESILPTEQR